jgi:hypothetical protein
MSAIDILKQQRGSSDMFSPNHSLIFTFLWIADILRRMLLLNEPMTSVDSLHWKVLVFDQFSRDILAPLLNVGELRKLGVTLHLFDLSMRRNHVFPFFIFRI